MQVDYLKLIFWLLTFLSVIMTGIAGASANHLVTQVDSIGSRITYLESVVSGLSETRTDNSRRLQRIEDKLDVIGVKQDFVK